MLFLSLSPLSLSLSTPKHFEVIEGERATEEEAMAFCLRPLIPPTSSSSSGQPSSSSSSSSSPSICLSSEVWGSSRRSLARSPLLVAPPPPSSSLSLLRFPPAFSHPIRRLHVLSMLPSAVSRSSPTTKSAKWSERAIKSFSMAELEARKMKHLQTGTEALLMGILTEGTNETSKYVRAKGVTLFGIRDETIKILGKGDMYNLSPEHPPLAEDALKALDWAIELKRRKSGEDGEITTAHLLLGIWAQKGSTGQRILANLGFNDECAGELEQMAENVKLVSRN